MTSRGRSERRNVTRGTPVRERVKRLSWSRIAASLDEEGYARISGLLTAAECRSLAALYRRETLFRKHIDMERHRFGRGEYRYFGYPLPELVANLRTALYPPLARIANAWNASLGVNARFPTTLARFLAECRDAGQTRPTPLILRYGAGGYNRLHQDLYGTLAFPLQVTVLLSRPERDFRGGDFLLVEQRPRMQSRGVAVDLRRGEAVVFPVRERPVRGARGFHRAVMRHGVSTLDSGERAALGLIFHDAK